MEHLLSVEQAREIILSNFKKNKSTTIPLEQANGKVLAADVFAIFNMPPFSNSSMDGFAVKAEDTRHATPDQPAELVVIEDIAAGYHPKSQINNGQSSRIMTGGPLPSGANAVIPVENTNFSDRYNQRALPSSVLIYKPANRGDNVRPEGQDIHQGEKIFQQGHKLRAQDLGSLAAQGIAEVEVVKNPVIALLSSGDELLKPGDPLVPGKIFDSNTITIKTLLESFGATVINLGVAKDNIRDIKAKLDLIKDLDLDLLISTAGVSVGVFDLIRDVILDNGKLNFWKVNMRPGKPLTFGEFQSVPFIGLPGNPVSAFVSSLVFVKPVIQHLLGIDQKEELFKSVVDEEISSDGRESYLRAEIRIVNGVYHARLARHQGSANILSLVYANALLIIPAGVKSVPEGKIVDFFWI